MNNKVQDADIKGKKIILRCDFNVPMQDGKILDTSKIDKSLETINYLLEQDCSIVILSHLGKVKVEDDKRKNTLEPVADYLNEIMDYDVMFSRDTRSVELDIKVKNMKKKEILLIENTRYEDIPDKLESNNDPQLSAYWSNLGDIFVLDAFASAHRAHASTVGITKFIPSYFGFLVQKEIEMLDTLVLNAKKPFTLLMGGAKVEDKLDLLYSLIDKCDYLLLSGALANACLKALNVYIGESFATNDLEIIDKMKKLMLDNKEKIVLPLDAIVGSTYDNNFAEYRMISDIKTDDVIYDIGIQTIKKYKEIIDKSETIFVNGTVGKYEDMKFANGMKEILSILSKASATVVIGGGDSVSSINNLGFNGKITNLSSGGGATLEYLAKGTLVAIDAINQENNRGTYEILDI